LVWTHGGYQIARSQDDYPIFIQVDDQDVERWIAFFERYGIEMVITERPDADAVDGNVSYVLYSTRDGIESQWIDGDPVIPLEAAVEQMVENRPVYEPALEIIAEELGGNRRNRTSGITLYETEEFNKFKSLMEGMIDKQ
jgi:hypothetical protein